MEVPNARWQDLCLKLDVPSSVGLAWFELMKKRYAEPWRFYHTMRHVEALLLGLAAEMSVVQCEEALLLAIFFHDLVYDPRSKTNEADSANLFKQFADEAKLNSRKQSLVESVVDMILQTANHMGVNVETASADKLVFLDLDLAILGSPNDAYSTYAKEIRKEYIHISDNDFVIGRSKVLENFLSKPVLYFTSNARKRLEEQARFNIARELEELKNSRL